MDLLFANKKLSYLRIIKVDWFIINKFDKFKKYLFHEEHKNSIH